MTLEIIPGQSVGPIQFGCRLEDLVERLELHEEESDVDGTDRWNWHGTASGDLVLQTCNGAVVTVICERQCSYRGRTLIGMSESALRMLFADRTMVEGDVPELGQVLEVSELGLQFGFSSGSVESVTIGVDPDSVLGASRPATP